MGGIISNASITVETIRDGFTDARRHRTYIGTVALLTGEPYSEELSKAILIHLAETSSKSDLDRDILLASWELLEGFNEGKVVGKRREDFVLASGYVGRGTPLENKLAMAKINNDELKKQIWRLEKHENRLYNEIAEECIKRLTVEDEKHEHYYDINKIESLVCASKIANYDSVTGRAIIPQPSFRKKETISSGNYSLRNLMFIGREDVLSELHNNYFNEDHPATTQVLCGMAGIGKTSIALEYIYRNRPLYDIVWWLDGSNETTLTNSCAQLLEQKDKTYSKTDDKERIRQRFLDFLSKRPGWLLIFDNADYLDEDTKREERLIKNLRAHMPPDGGHILITTRCNRPADWFHQISIELFSHDTSIQYMGKVTGIPADGFAHTLVERLGNLPLALCYAAHFIKGKTDYHGYLTLWDQYQMKLFDQNKYSYADRTVRQAFQITLDKLECNNSSEDTEMLSGLLRLCALFDAEYFPIDASPASWTKIPCGTVISSAKAISPTTCCSRVPVVVVAVAIYITASTIARACLASISSSVTREKHGLVITGSAT